MSDENINTLKEEPQQKMEPENKMEPEQKLELEQKMEPKHDLTNTNIQQSMSPPITTSLPTSIDPTMEINKIADAPVIVSDNVLKKTDTLLSKTIKIKEKIKNFVKGFTLKNIRRKINGIRKSLKNPLIRNQVNNLMCKTGTNIKYAVSNTSRNLFYDIPGMGIIFTNPGNPPKINTCDSPNNISTKIKLDETTIIPAAMAMAAKEIDAKLEDRMGRMTENAKKSGLDIITDIPPIGIIMSISKAAEAGADVVKSGIAVATEIGNKIENIQQMMGSEVEITPGGFKIISGGRKTRKMHNIYNRSIHTRKSFNKPHSHFNIQ